MAWRAVAAVVAVVVVVTGCSGGATDVGQPVLAAGESRPLEGVLTVSAASSLGGAFERIADEFTATNPSVEVVLNLDASSTLATGIIEGTGVDVFASADTTAMDRLIDAGVVAGEPSQFATNDLVIVTEAGNPRGIASLADVATLARTEVVALCVEQAPCGRYAAQAFEAAGVTLDESGVTRARNAAAALAAVADGDAAAGVVYATDARIAGDRVAVIALPAALGVVPTYPIAVTATATNSMVARAFVDWVVGPAGQAVLAANGFGPPP